MTTMLPGMRGVTARRHSPAKIRTAMDLLIAYQLVIPDTAEQEEAAATDMALGIAYLPVVVNHQEAESARASMGLGIAYQRVIFAREADDAARAAMEIQIAYVRTIFGPPPQEEAARATQSLLINYEPA